MTVHDIHQNGIGRIAVKTLPLPDGIQAVSATYTPSGSVLLTCKSDGDPADTDYQNIAVLNDEGTGFRIIFSDVIKRHPTANGVRYMVFADNERVLLGDYVLECSPDIDNCESAKLVPVEYPRELMEDPKTTAHWSEIIIAPDNGHIAWTTLRSGIGAAALLGRLSRKEDRYCVEGAQIISSLEYIREDPERPGFLIPLDIRGGEVKQFVRGGTAISIAGAAGDSVLTDSVAQDLSSGRIDRITNTPGYDETTIFSPDERLGLVMSSRASPKTDPAVFGLLPRPAYAIRGMIMCFYMYAVAGVRKFRKGNAGPVLINIERSRSDENYRGTALNDPDEQWVYYSPMSWHPGNKKVMWPEGLRGTDKMRIRIAELPDYVPGPPVPPQKTPDSIPCAETDLSRLQSSGAHPVSGKIAGKHSGHIEYRRGKEGAADSTELIYVNFSDDGKRFYRGREKSVTAIFAESVYEADLAMSGEESGEMKLRAAFSRMSWTDAPKLLFEKAADGKPKSCGYASYKGITLRVEDMRE